MKKNAYIHDIRDTLGDTNTSENAQSIAKKIKSAQKKAFPSIEFKQHLWDRLSNIYAVQTVDDITPRFSLMQLFWAFASFIFIAGGIFSFYQIHEIQDLEISPEHETLSIPSNSLEMKMLPVDEQNMQDTNMQDQEFIPENNSDATENIIIQEQETTPNQELEQAASIMQTDDTSSSDDTELEPAMMRSMRFSQDSNDDNFDENIFPENDSESDMFESSIYSADSFSVDTIDTTPNIFSDLCETYMWNYNFETQVCTLQYGTECSEYDEDAIFQCYSRDNTLSR